MELESFKVHKRLLVNKFITYLYIVYIFTPILYKNMYLGLGLFILWLISCILNKKALKLILNHKYNHIVYLWIIYIFIMRIIGFSKAAWGNYFIVIMFLFPIIIYNVQNNIWTLKEKKNLVKFCFFIISVNLLDNIRLIITYPDITKELNFVSTYNNLNIGDTIYSLVLNIFTIILIWIFINKKKSIIMFVVLLMGMIYPALAGKTTAMLILYFCVILLIIKKNFSKLDTNISIAISVVLFILAVFMIPEILEFLSENINNINIAERLKAIYTLDLNSIYFGRIELGRMSLDTFFKNPIIGIGYQKVELNGSLSNVYHSGIGHHSEIIDHLARYGIIGIIFYYVISVQYIDRMKKEFKSSIDKDLISVVIISFIMFSILNNSFIAPVGMMIFMILPFVVQVYSLDKEVE